MTQETTHFEKKARFKRKLRSIVILLLIGVFLAIIVDIIRDENVPTMPKNTGGNYTQNSITPNKLNVANPSDIPVKKTPAVDDVTNVTSHDTTSHEVTSNEQNSDKIENTSPTNVTNIDDTPSTKQQKQSEPTEKETQQASNKNTQQINSEAKKIFSENNSTIQEENQETHKQDPQVTKTEIHSKIKAEPNKELASSKKNKSSEQTLEDENKNNKQTNPGKNEDDNAAQIENRETNYTQQNTKKTQVEKEEEVTTSTVSHPENKPLQDHEVVVDEKTEEQTKNSLAVTESETKQKNLKQITGTEIEESYVVQPNDTLSEIARKKYDNFRYWIYIAQHNNIEIDDTKSLKIGQKILLPAIIYLKQHYIPKAKSSEKDVSLENKDPKYGYYKVKRGDNLCKIAKAFEMDIVELLSYNQNLKNNPNLVKIDQFLKIPRTKYLANLQNK